MSGGRRNNLPTNRTERLRSILDMGESPKKTKRPADSKQSPSPLSQHRGRLVSPGMRSGSSHGNTPFASGLSTSPAGLSSRKANTPFASRYASLGNDAFPSNSMRRTGSGDSINGTSMSRIRSAPALAGGMRRARKYGSNDSLISVASSKSSASGHSGVSGRKNAMVQMAQRSNASSVKTVINELLGICAIQKELAKSDKSADEKAKSPIDIEGDTNDENDLLEPPETPVNEALEPPLQECAMLAQWSVDAYYKVVISKYHGINAIVTAMELYPANADIQAYGCTVMKNMSNKMLVHQSRGTKSIFAAMRIHPTSIHVQSEACEALHNGLAKTMLQMAHQEEFEALQNSTVSLSDSFCNGDDDVDENNDGDGDDTPKTKVSDIVDEILPLLQHAKDMYLTQHGREAAQAVYALLLPHASSKLRFSTVREEVEEEEGVGLDAPPSEMVAPSITQNPSMSMHSSMGMSSVESLTPPPPTKPRMKPPSSPINMEISM